MNHPVPPPGAQPSRIVRRARVAAARPRSDGALCARALPRLTPRPLTPVRRPHPSFSLPPPQNHFYLRGGFAEGIAFMRNYMRSFGHCGQLIMCAPRVGARVQRRLTPPPPP
jgi:hypothetical protein